MPITYEPITTTTLSSSVAAIDFTSIPATYTDLRLVLVGTVSTAGVFPIVRYNNNATNYSMTYVSGNGSSVFSSRSSNATYFAPFEVNGMSDTVPQIITMDIFSYAGATNKTTLMTTSGDKNGSGDVERYVCLWRNTAAITSVKLDASNWNSSTTATLYGIKNA
jgi:hypothetical protein